MKVLWRRCVAFRCSDVIYPKCRAAMVWQMLRFIFNLFINMLFTLNGLRNWMFVRVCCLRRSVSRNRVKHQCLWPPQISIQYAHKNELKTEASEQKTGQQILWSQPWKTTYASIDQRGISGLSSQLILFISCTDNCLPLKLYVHNIESVPTTTDPSYQYVLRAYVLCVLFLLIFHRTYHSVANKNTHSTLSYVHGWMAMFSDGNGALSIWTAIAAKSCIFRRSESHVSTATTNHIKTTNASEYKNCCRSHFVTCVNMFRFISGDNSLRYACAISAWIVESHFCGFFANIHTHHTHAYHDMTDKQDALQCACVTHCETRYHVN